MLRLGVQPLGVELLAAGITLIVYIFLSTWIASSWQPVIFCCLLSALIWSFLTLGVNREYNLLRYDVISAITILDKERGCGGWLTGWLTEWLAGILAGWLPDWFAGWLTVCMSHTHNADPTDKAWHRSFNKCFSSLNSYIFKRVYKYTL